MKQIETREGARRQHRCLAMYCALYCWHHEKKAVFVQTESLLFILGLERLREVRMQWLKEDGEAYFPHIFRREMKIEKKDSIIFSRISKNELLANKDQAIHFKPAIFELADYRSNCWAGEGEKEVKIFEESFPFISSVRNLHEFAVLNTLTLLANGAIDPTLALSKA